MKDSWRIMVCRVDADQQLVRMRADLQIGISMGKWLLQLSGQEIAMYRPKLRDKRQKTKDNLQIWLFLEIVSVAQMLNRKEEEKKEEEAVLPLCIAE